MLYNPLSVFAKKIESGFKFGLSISLGTHIQRLGVMAGAYLQTNRVQGMIMIRPHWMKQPNGHHSLFEIQCSEGIYLLSGSKNSIPMSLALLHEGSNFSRRPFAIGFHLKHYLDNNHTSQTTGIWVISYRQVSFSIENDAFLFSYRDRFRTATLMMMYEWQTRTQHAIGQSLLLGTKIQLYTGDALGKASVRKHDSLILLDMDIGTCQKPLMGNSQKALQLFTSNQPYLFNNQFLYKWVLMMKGFDISFKINGYMI